jgi:outer membrane receptor for ferrienterochelin and colicin
MKRYTSVVAVLLLAVSAVGQAQQEEPQKDYSDVSLEKLLQLETVTAAMKRQTAAEAPAVISVLTAEDLRKLGVNTLYEALNHMPGVLVTESYFGYTMVNIRGILSTHYNDKVLLLINGHPMREVVNGSFHMEIVPIQAVERIELVRGPGSALYGTNAFAGVINIITRKGASLQADNGSRKVSAEIVGGGGSYSTFEGSVAVGAGSETRDYIAVAGLRNDQGYPFRVTADERGASGVIDYENDVANFWGSARFNEVTVSGAYFDQDKAKFGITPVLEYSGPTRYKGGLLDLTWDHPLRQKLNMSARLRYDTLSRESDARHFPYDGFLGHANADTEMYSSGDLFGAELQWDWTASSKASLLAGAVYEYRKTDPYPFRFLDDNSLSPMTAFVDSHSANDISLFGQGLIQLRTGTQLVLGLRFDNNSVAGSFVAPRLGLVHSLAHDTFVKVLYAEAYRTPEFFEQYVTTYNVLYGNPDLKPEKIRSFDVALDTTYRKKTNFQFDAFVLSTDDLITRIRTTTPELHGPNADIYINSTGERIWGIETGVRTSAGPSVTLSATYSFRKGTNKATSEDLVYLGEHTINAELSWKVTNQLLVYPNLQYVSSRGNVDSYALLNLVAEVRVSPRLKFVLSGQNLTDKQYSYPEYVRRRIDVIPGGPGRSFMVRGYWGL